MVNETDKAWLTGLPKRKSIVPQTGVCHFSPLCNLTRQYVERREMAAPEIVYALITSLPLKWVLARWMRRSRLSPRG